MKYKLIAIDMDGTLLNSNHDVSDKNKEVIKRAIENGINIVVSTGRIFVSARYYAKLIGASTPIIACNGAYIKGKLFNDEILIDRPIRRIDINKIINILEKNNVKYRYYDDENFYTTSMDYITEKYKKWNEYQKPEDEINIVLVENSYEALKNIINIYKFVVMEDDNQKLNMLKNEILENCEVEIVSSWINTFDIMYKKVSKGSALEELCNKLNINKEEVIAIGDNENDLSMIKFAGCGVAMGNGEDIVKAAADVITDTNDNDGVAKIINKLIFDE